MSNDVRSQLLSDLTALLKERRYVTNIPSGLGRDVKDQDLFGAVTAFYDAYARGREV